MFQPLIDCGRISDAIRQNPRARLAILLVSACVLVSPYNYPFYLSLVLMGFYAVIYVLAVFILLHIFDRRLTFLVTTSWEFLYLGGIVLVSSSATICQAVMFANLSSPDNNPNWVAGVVLVQVAVFTATLLLFASDAAIALSKWHKIAFFVCNIVIGVRILLVWQLDTTAPVLRPLCVAYLYCGDVRNIQISCMNTLTVFSAKYVVSLLRNHTQMVIMRSRINIHQI